MASPDIYPAELTKVPHVYEGQQVFVLQHAAPGDAPQQLAGSMSAATVEHVPRNGHPSVILHDDGSGNKAVAPTPISAVDVFPVDHVQAIVKAASNGRKTPTNLGEALQNDELHNQIAQAAGKIANERMLGRRVPSKARAIYS